MIKADIINRVAEDARITKVKAVEAVEAVFDAMKAAMQRGERIELRGFGVFQVKPRKKGIGRNPRTGREVRMEEANEVAVDVAFVPAHEGSLRLDGRVAGCADGYGDDVQNCRRR